MKANKGTYFGLCFYGELKIVLGYGKKKLIFRFRLFILFGGRFLVGVVVVFFKFFYLSPQKVLRFFVIVPSSHQTFVRLIIVLN